MPGRIIHRHKQSSPLALMNTAAAELPHHRRDAAVQLLRLYGFKARISQKKRR
jgi:hypothetical protein